MGVKVEVVSHSAEVLGAVGNKRQIILKKWGIAGETNAKEEIDKAVYNTPESKSGYVRTGRLRNSLTHAVQDRSMYIGTNVEYAPYVELGTSKMKARPYLKPAIENHMSEYKEIAEDVMKS